MMVYSELMAEYEKVRVRKEQDFFELADLFRGSDDPAEVNRLGDEFGRFIFGESQIENMAG